MHCTSQHRPHHHSHSHDRQDAPLHTHQAVLACKRKAEVCCQGGSVTGNGHMQSSVPAALSQLLLWPHSCSPWGQALLGTLLVLAVRAQQADGFLWSPAGPAGRLALALRAQCTALLSSRGSGRRYAVCMVRERPGAGLRRAGDIAPGILHRLYPGLPAASTTACHLISWAAQLLWAGQTGACFL